MAKQNGNKSANTTFLINALPAAMIKPKSLPGYNNTLLLFGLFGSTSFIFVATTTVRPIRALPGVAQPKRISVVPYNQYI